MKLTAVSYSVQVFPYIEYSLCHGHACAANTERDKSELLLFSFLYNIKIHSIHVLLSVFNDALIRRDVAPA